MEDPRKIKLPKKPGEHPKAKCDRCGRWIALVHKTKSRPYGSRLARHKGSFEDRDCWGTATLFSN